MEQNDKKEERIKKQCNIEVGNRLRRLLDQNGVSMIDFATALDMSPGNASKICSGMQGLNTDKMRIIFDEFKIVPNDYLLSDEERSEVCTLEMHIDGIRTILEKMKDEEKTGHLKEYLKLIAENLG